MAASTRRTGKLLFVAVAVTGLQLAEAAGRHASCARPWSACVSEGSCRATAVADRVLLPGVRLWDGRRTLLGGPAYERDDTHLAWLGRAAVQVAIVGAVIGALAALEPRLRRRLLATGHTRTGFAVAHLVLFFALLVERPRLTPPAFVRGWPLWVTARDTCVLEGLPPAGLHLAALVADAVAVGLLVLLLMAARQEVWRAQHALTGGATR